MLSVFLSNVEGLMSLFERLPSSETDSFGFAAAFSASEPPWRNTEDGFLPVPNRPVAAPTGHASKRSRGRAGG